MYVIRTGLMFVTPRVHSSRWRWVTEITMLYPRYRFSSKVFEGWVMVMVFIFQLYRVRPLFWWSKSEYPEKNNDLTQVTAKLRRYLHLNLNFGV